VIVVPDAPKWFTPEPFQIVKTVDPISTSTPVIVMAPTGADNNKKLNQAAKLKSFLTVFFILAPPV
jgi:hypothetical protein